MLGLRFCARAFSICGKWGPLFIAVRGPLTIAAPLAAEHRLQTRRLSNYGSRAQPLRGMRDPPRPGLEPVSLALAGRLSTTAPPGKPYMQFYIHFYSNLMYPFSLKHIIKLFVNIILIFKWFRNINLVDIYGIFCLASSCLRCPVLRCLHDCCRSNHVII